MAPRITIDFDVLHQHAKTLVGASDDLAEPMGPALDGGIDEGAFGMVLAPVGVGASAVSLALSTAIADAAGALGRTAGTVLDVSLHFGEVEQAASVALDAMHDDITPHTDWFTGGPWGRHTDAAPDSPLRVTGSAHHTQWTTGLYLVDDIQELCDGIAAGDWIDIVLGGASTAMDVAALVDDPIGSLVAMGAGWVLEHLNPIADWYTQTAGDPDRAADVAASWRAIAGRLQDVATDVRVSHRWLDDLDGETVEAMQQFGRDLLARLDAVARAADAFATGLELLTTVVTTVHDLLRDILGQIIGTVVSASVELASTALLAAPLVVEQIGTHVAQLLPRASRAMRDLMSTGEALLRLLSRLGDHLDDLALTFRLLMRDERGAVDAGALAVGRLKRSPLREPKGMSSPGAGSRAYLMDPPPPSTRPTAGVTGTGQGWRFEARRDTSAEENLAAHARKHEELLGISSTSDYASRADDFVSGVRDPDTFVMGRGGGTDDLIYFNTRTLEFAITGVDPSGKHFIRTYFIPEPRKQGFANYWEYFLSQRRS